jgi:hypothetical protein
LKAIELMGGWVRGPEDTEGLPPAWTDSVSEARFVGIGAAAVVAAYTHMPC